MTQWAESSTMSSPRYNLNSPPQTLRGRPLRHTSRRPSFGATPFAWGPDKQARQCSAIQTTLRITTDPARRGIEALATHRVRDRPFDHIRQCCGDPISVKAKRPRSSLDQPLQPRSTLGTTRGFRNAAARVRSSAANSWCEAGTFTDEPDPWPTYARSTRPRRCLQCWSVQGSRQGRPTPDRHS